MDGDIHMVAGYTGFGLLGYHFGGLFGVGLGLVVLLCIFIAVFSTAPRGAQ